MDSTRLGRPPSELTAEEQVDEPAHFHVSQDITINERNDQNWTAFFASNQHEDESVSQYSNRIVALADDLNQYDHLPEFLLGTLVFNRVKAGLQDSIKGILNAQTLQPKSHKTLNDMAMAIEQDLRRKRGSSHQSLLENGTRRHIATDYQQSDNTVVEHSENTDYDDTQEQPLQILGRHQVERASEGLQGTKRKGRNEDQVEQYQTASPAGDDYGELSRRISVPPPKRPKQQVLCHYCHEPGHMKGQCPKKKLR